MELNSCIIRVVDETGSFVHGAGFFVGQGQILTCAHVVCTAFNQGLNCLRPEGDVFVDFPGLEFGRRIRTRVTAWCNDDTLDFALLRPLEELPPGVEAPPLMTVPVEQSIHHPFLAFGFPQKILRGVGALGEVVKTETRGWIQIEAVKEVGQFIQQGFSGGPVYDEALCAVTGMVVAIIKDASHTAFMIPLSLIADYLDHPRPETENVDEESRSLLTRAAFENLSAQWQVAAPEELKIHPQHAASPLRPLWNGYLAAAPWHERMAEHLNKIETTAQAAGGWGLEPLVKAVRHIDLHENYEALLRQFEAFANDKNLTRLVRQLRDRLEKETGVNASELRRRLARPVQDETTPTRPPKFTPAEEALLHVDTILHEREILRRMSETPRFGRCFFVIGNMGAGKTHFVGAELLDQYADEEEPFYWHDLILPLEPRQFSGDFDQLVLSSLWIASGIHWPNLETFIRFLDACNQHGSGAARLVVAVDDVSHWEQMYADQDFTTKMIRCIRDSTQYHPLYWWVSLPYTGYSHLVDRAGLERDFWTRYAEEPSPVENYIDCWLVLDDLNKKAQTGISIILERLESRSDEDEVNLAVTQAGDKGTLEHLSNPLIAWVFLDLLGTLPVETAINLNYIAFIEAFWDQQMRRLAGLRKRLSQQDQGEKELTENDLKIFVRCTARFLAKTDTVSFPRHHLIQAIQEMAENGSTFGDFRRIEKALDVLARSMLMREHSRTTSILQDPTPKVEVRFDSFWAMLLAQEILERVKPNPELHGADVEQQIVQLAPHLRNPTLEFFLLLLDQPCEQQGDEKPILAFCDRILQKNSLPHGPVWLAGAKAGKAMQKALVRRAGSAARAGAEASSPMDGDTLVAFLYFLCELPRDLLYVPTRFRTIRPLYPFIQPNTYAPFFFYVAGRLFKMLDTLPELVQTMTFLSGCEPMGLTDALGSLAVDTLERLLVEEEGRAPEELERRSVRIVRWLHEYLDAVVEEDVGRRAVPGKPPTWQRYFFREFVLFHAMRLLVRTIGVESYPLLVRMQWYDTPRLNRINPELMLEKEREANIAIGGIFRYGEAQERKFIHMVEELVASREARDRRNAFFIIRHSGLITREDPLPLLDSRLHPALRRLYLDRALSDIVVKKDYQDLFRKNLKDFDQLEKERQRMNAIELPGWQRRKKKKR